MLKKPIVRKKTLLVLSGYFILCLLMNNFSLAGKEKTKKRVNKVTPVFHVPVEYRACHNFPAHHLTGVFDYHRVDHTRLLQILRNSQFRLIRSYKNPALVNIRELKYGDIITLENAHSGIVGFYQKAAYKKLICHFRGFTVWDASKKVIKRSDWSNIKGSHEKHDHGIYCHTPVQLGKYSIYSKKYLTVYRSSWVGRWKVVSFKVSMGREKIDAGSGETIDINIKPLSLKMGKAKLTLSNPFALTFPYELDVILKAPKLARSSKPRGATSAFQLRSHDRLEAKIIVREEGKTVTLDIIMRKQI